MTEYETPQTSGLKLDDVIFIVVTHKWKLIVCSALGLLAALVTYVRYPAEYESEAKLLVRYVVDKSSVDANEIQMRPGATGETMLSTEAEILGSYDLAKDVAEAVTPEKLFPGVPKPSLEDALGVVSGGLRVTSNAARSNVITVAFKHRDPEIARMVLNKLVSEYFVKHLQVHRSTGNFDFVSQQTDQLRSRLAQNEEDIKKLKEKAGIISPDQARKAMDEHVAGLQEQVDATEAERSEQAAKVKELSRLVTASEPTSPGQAPQPVQPDEADQYQAIRHEITELRKSGIALRAKYTSDSRFVTTNRAQIAELEAIISQMEAKNPELRGVPIDEKGPAAKAQLSALAVEQARLVAIEARAAVLGKQLAALKDAAKRFAEVDTELVQLERKRSVDQKNYEYFQSSLEKARIDEALDPSKMPNISVVQAASPSARTSRNLRKMLTMLSGGGVALGVALVFLTEFIVDPSVKRASELQTKGIPLLHSIPSLGGKSRRRLFSANRKGNADGCDALVKDVTVLEPAFASLRDRLILYFELNNLFHMPKLVAVTGCTEGVGTSTVAGGLASALAQTGEGKVLLVDMNRNGSDSENPLFPGRPSITVTEALRGSAAVEAVTENLFLATAGESGEGAVQIIPRRFCEMVPHFKASMYDYIVFDMPPVDQSCAALAIASSVDKMLLVAGANQTHRDEVHRAYSELLSAKAKVSCILNKATNQAGSLFPRAA